MCAVSCMCVRDHCATTVDNRGVYVCYLKDILSVCFRCQARTVDFSGTRLTCVSTTNQAERRSSATHPLARWEHERTTTWWSGA